MGAEEASGRSDGHPAVHVQSAHGLL